jgi:hypothetical protein
LAAHAQDLRIFVQITRRREVARRLKPNSIQWKRVPRRAALRLRLLGKDDRLCHNMTQTQELEKDFEIRATFKGKSGEV